MSKASSGKAETPVEKLEVSVYKIPTDLPEADGTIAWDSTTLVLVEAHGGGSIGTGYSYADSATARLIQETLAKQVVGVDAVTAPSRKRDGFYGLTPLLYSPTVIKS